MVKQGTVEFYSEVKGFGFIKPDDGGTSIMVPFSSLKSSGFMTLVVGQRVKFVVEDGPKGLSAANVMIID